MKVANLIHRYGFFDTIKLALDLIHAKLPFNECRIIQRPIHIRSDKKQTLGKNSTVGIGLRLDCFSESTVHFGNDIQIDDHVHIAAISQISTGYNTLIASRVFISDHNHGRFDGRALEDGPDTPPAQRPLHAKPVHIGKKVWIGESVCVLPGVTVGDGAVIGAGSVVMRDAPARWLAAGNPARVIRQCSDTFLNYK
jgi:lipopolysaccharide O-acetyltransferase